MRNLQVTAEITNITAPPENTSMDRRDTDFTYRIRVLQLFPLYGFIISLGCLVLLMAIPTDPKNIWLLGYSKTRLLLFIGYIAMTLIFLSLVIKSKKDIPWVKSISQWIARLIDGYGWFFPLWIFGVGVCVLGPYIAILIKNPLEGFYLRIFPLVLYASLLTLGICVVFGVALVDEYRRRSKDDDRKIFQINPRKVVVVLSAILILFVLANFAGNFIDMVAYDPKLFRYTKKLYLDRETSIPTYFASLLLLISAILFGFIARLKTKSNSPYKVHWIILSVIFLLMSVDETASLHEQLNKPMRLMFNQGGIFLFGWVIVAIPLVILFVVAFFRFFFHLPRKTKILFGLAGGLYVGGAIGFELVGAGYVSQYGKQNFTYIIIAMIEESMEVTGLVFLIYALLDYVSSTYDSKRFKLVISESDGLQLIEDG